MYPLIFDFWLDKLWGLVTVYVASEGADDLQFAFHASLPHAKFSIGVEVYYIVTDLAVHAPCVRETKCSTTHWFRNQWWRQPHTPFLWNSMHDFLARERDSGRITKVWNKLQSKDMAQWIASCSVISQTISSCRLAAHQFHSWVGSSEASSSV